MSSPDAPATRLAVASIAAFIFSLTIKLASRRALLPPCIIFIVRSAITPLASTANNIKGLNIRCAPPVTRGTVRYCSGTLAYPASGPREAERGLERKLTATLGTRDRVLLLPLARPMKGRLLSLPRCWGRFRTNGEMRMGWGASRQSPAATCHDLNDPPDDPRVA